VVVSILVLVNNATAMDTLQTVIQTVESVGIVNTTQKEIAVTDVLQGFMEMQQEVVHPTVNHAHVH